MNLTRRQFSSALAAAGTAAVSASLIPSPVFAQARARVVIIGGGAGGASVAQKLKTASPKLDVTLIEIHPTYTSCFLSEHVLGGFRTLNSLTHNYEGLRNLGVTVIEDWASGIDTTKKQVTLKSGNVLLYDKLVLSPGIDLRYDKIEGYSPEVALKLPHAWKLGKQTAILRNQLLDMADGDTVLMGIPPGTYRGQTAAYARASMIAHYIKYHKPNSKLTILDANETFEQRETFEYGWAAHYENIIDHKLSTETDKFQVVRVDPNTRELETAGGARFKATIVSLIPEQRAGVIARVSGCTDGIWCPVNPATFESARVPDIYVLGDAAEAGAMPKTAFAAQSQADAVANHIGSVLSGKKRFPARFRSTMWALLATNNAIKIGGSYLAGDDKVEVSSSFVSAPKEAPELRAQNYAECLAWYGNVTKAMFGS